ncbi:hypothetical protein [Vibrio mediterranei]|uniref:hypothetical protein n=1 Tax=Vibrio mediterranei TaxID=689 RepID=UPI004068EC5F
MQIQQSYVVVCHGGMGPDRLLFSNKKDANTMARCCVDRYQDGYATHILHRVDGFVGGKIVPGTSGVYRREGVRSNGEVVTLDIDERFELSKIQTRLEDRKKQIALGLSIEEVSSVRKKVRQVAVKHQMRGEHLVVTDEDVLKELFLSPERADYFKPDVEKALGQISADGCEV